MLGRRSHRVMGAYFTRWSWFKGDLGEIVAKERVTRSWYRPVIWYFLCQINHGS